MLWIVGKVSKEFATYCTDKDIAYGQFTARPHVADGKSIIYVDMRSAASVRQSLQALPGRPVVDGILVTGYEQYVLPAAWIAEYFEVPSLSPAAARAATDKALMRQAFMEYDPAITPEYALVQQWDDAERFAKQHGFPVILKPANLMKSLFVSKNDSLEELRQHYEAMCSALPAVYERYRLGEPRIVIEECLIGSMHTVAGFTDSTGKLSLLDDVVDCITAADIGKHDSYIFARRLPTQLTDDQAEALKVATQKGVAALGLTSIPIHAELMLTATGPKIIEIGARLGGYRPRMYGFTRGLDLYRAAIDTALQQQLNLQPTAERTCAVLEIFPEHEGTFAGITEQAAMLSLPSHLYSKVSVHSGDMTGPATTGYRAPLVVMLGHDEPSQVAHDTEWIKTHSTILTQP